MKKITWIDGFTVAPPEKDRKHYVIVGAGIQEGDTEAKVLMIPLTEINVQILMDNLPVEYNIDPEFVIN